MGRKPHVDSKRAEILQAAIRLFAAQGVDATSVKQIAAAAGVTDAALYKHFSSKDELAAIIYMRYADIYTRMIDGAAAGPGGFGDRIDGLVAAILRFHAEDADAILLMEDRNQLSRALTGRERTLSEALGELIAGGINSGALPPQDPKVTGALFFGAMIRLLVWCDEELLSPSPEARLPEIQERIRGLFGLLR